LNRAKRRLKFERFVVEERFLVVQERFLVREPERRLEPLRAPDSTANARRDEGVGLAPSSFYVR
jgi:hypothetical protein